MIRLDTIQALPEVTGYQGFRKTLKKNGSLSNTLFHIERIARENQYQVRDLAYELEGETVEQTARNIWEYFREKTKYKLDAPGFEELRTPARSWYDRHIGIDCDDYTILVSTVLLVLNIPHEYRVTSYHKQGKFEHIYPVAFDQNNTPFVIDIVPEIPHFNYEQNPIIDLITVPMEIQELSGVGELPPTLSQELFSQMNQPLDLSGIDEDDMLEYGFLQGLGEVDAESQADIVLSGSDIPELLERGILAEINKARAALMKEQQTPTELTDIVNVPRELQTIVNIMEAWPDEEDRRELIEEAINQNSKYASFYKAILVSLDELESIDTGLSGIQDDEEFFFQRVTSMVDDDLEDIIEDAELAGRKRKGRLKNFFKKVGRGIKKGLTAIVKHNPGMILLRSAILLAMKTNVGKVASTLIYGYLTEAEALNNGLDLNEWRKLVSIKDAAEKRFKKKGGKVKNFRNAVIKGRAAKKTGIQLGAVVATTAASTAAASGFIAFMKRLFKKINPAKLFRKRKNKRKDMADTSFTDESAPTPTENNSGSNLPVVTDRGDQLPSNSGDFSSPDNSSLAPESNKSDINNSKPGLKQKAKEFWSKNKKSILFVSLGLTIILVIIIWQKNKKPKRGRPKGAKTLSGVRKKKSVKRRPTKRKSLAGSTTSIRVPSASMRVKKMSNGMRFKKMHEIAKRLQKKHPKTPYGKLLSRASKQV